MIHRYEDFTLLPCVCYLPPHNSSRYFDVNCFYDSLLMDVYTYQNDGMIVISGDFNSRCGEMQDFIVNVDDIPARDIIDFTTNAYGELLIEFLNNSNMCMLNGRNCMQNDYTSVSVKGSSVVDYCIITHDNVSNLSNFAVTLTSDLINNADNLSILAPTSIPDHSLLTWHIDNSITNTDTSKPEVHCSYDKFDVNCINGSFLSSDEVLRHVNIAIDKLELGLRTHNDVDSVYQDVCSIVKTVCVTIRAYCTCIYQDN